MKKFFSAILLMTAMVLSVGTFVACNDLTEEMEAVQTQATQNSAAIKALETQISKMKAQILELWEELPPTFVSSSETGMGREEILDYIGSVLESLKSEENQNPQIR